MFGPFFLKKDIDAPLTKMPSPSRTVPFHILIELYRVEINVVPVLTLLGAPSLLLPPHTSVTLGTSFLAAALRWQVLQPVVPDREAEAKPLAVASVDATGRVQASDRPGSAGMSFACMI